MNSPGALTADNVIHLLELPKGWAILWLELLQELPEGYKVSWAAESFGGLRLSPIGEHGNIILDAAQRSKRTCAVCGSPGRMQQRNGVYRPHCQACAAIEGFDDPPLVHGKAPEPEQNEARP